MWKGAPKYLVPVFVLSLLLIFANSAVAQELRKVRFGYPSLGFRQGHIWVAKDEGLFKKYGLDVEPIFLRGGQLAIQALAGGDPPLMSIGQVVQAGLAGFDLALIAGVEIYYDSTVFARPGITRLEQLKGKRLGISGYGAATHFAAIIVAQHLNLDPEHRRHKTSGRACGASLKGLQFLLDRRSWRKKAFSMKWRSAIQGSEKRDKPGFGICSPQRRGERRDFDYKNPFMIFAAPSAPPRFFVRFVMGYVL